MLGPVLLILILLFGVWLQWRYRHRRLLQMAKKIPGPPTVPLLGNAIAFMCQPEELIKVLKDFIHDYGNVLRFWLGADLNIVVSNPDDIRLLLSNSKMNVKGPQYKYMADFLGGGILSGSGAVWRKHRKIATPNYGKRAIESYNAIFNQEVEFLLEELRILQKNKDINIYNNIVKTTSYAVCQTLMGLSRDETLRIPFLQNIIEDSPRLYDIIFDRMTKWYLQIDPIFWLTESYNLQKNTYKHVYHMSKYIIKERLNKLAVTEGEDLELLNSDQDTTINTRLSVIDRFLLSKELNSKELIEETFTIFTSSQEATAKISSFLLLMMAYHPKCQDKLYAEITTVIGSRQGAISDDDLKQMPYLEKTFKEVLRLFPIGVMLQRTVSEDIEISTCTLPAGSSLMIPIFHIQRDPRFWDDPEAFDPERFSVENIKKRNPYCYIPFSLGPMNCLELIKVLKEFIHDYGNVLRFWLGADLNIVVSNPDDIRLLLSNSKMNVKGPQYKYMADFLGGGILSGSGAVWRKHRKIATPNYGKRAIESYNAIFNQEVEFLLEELRILQKNKDINIYNNIVKTTSYAVCQTLMGLSRDETLRIPFLQNIIEDSPRLYDIIFDRMTKWYLQIDPIFWLTESYNLQKNTYKHVYHMSKYIIKERLNKLAVTEGEDLELLNSDQDSTMNTRLSVIDRFLLSKELNSKELIEETFTIFTSSQEATAKISSFLLLMMAYHPKCQDKLYAEITTVIGSRQGAISDDDLKQMPYLEKTFKEVLRLFPIGVMLQRTVSEDIEISTCTLPAGSSLMIPIFHIQRDPRFWDDPEAFDPERFSVENIKKRNPYCYIPFSLGPMNCLGRYFGTKLVKTIAIKVLQEFKLTSLNDFKDLRVVMAISAKSLTGYPMTLTPR